MKRADGEHLAILVDRDRPDSKRRSRAVIAPELLGIGGTPSQADGIDDDIP